MYPKQKVVAMLLAGGQGKRLGILTEKLAKPAIPYGGKYRIIDFPLSNCVNSGIETVGVLTQYQPLVLNEYLGNGQPWDLDLMDGGLQILSPYQKSGGGDWYKGTANAIYQNIHYIERYNPEHVLIISGDHIYKMDYSKMIAFHEKNNADCTIAVINVPLDQAKRFGILNTHKDGLIYEFDEKPQKPKSTKASMGIYVFKWDKLKSYLIEDENIKDSSNDFGKDIMPRILLQGAKMYAYEFEGYWKDVGTIQSFWESNLDLLNPNTGINLNDKNWNIYSHSPNMSPHYISSQSKIENCIVAEGCSIHGNIKNSIIFPGVCVEKYSEICNSIIMPGAKIKSNCIIDYSIVCENTVINENSKIGTKLAVKHCNKNSKNKHNITVIDQNSIIKNDCELSFAKEDKGNMDVTKAI